MRPIDGDALFEKMRKAKWFDNADRDDIALELVLDAPTIAPPPKNPLTLEELREMGGEPVWNDTMKKWVLVDLTWEYGERTVDADGDWRGLDDRYYRRRPEEGMT